MTHIFISYHKDSSRAYARKLAHYLIERGFDVWIDDKIDFSRNWERTIFKAIDDSAALLVIMTPGSYASDWVQSERLYAKKVGKQVFPLLLDGDIFPAYLGSQIADVRDGSMPTDAFIQQIADVAPFTATRGQNIAVNASGGSKAVNAPARTRTRLISVVGGVGVIAVLLGIGANTLLNNMPPPTSMSEAAQPISEIQPSVETSTPDLQTQVWLDLTTTAFYSATNEATRRYLQFQQNAIATLTAISWTFTPSLTHTATHTNTSTATWTPVPTLTPSPTPTFMLTPTPLISATPTVFGGGNQALITFASDMAGEWDIYVMKVDGTEMHALTAGNGQQDLDPTWSPDAMQIAYAVMEDSDNYDVYIMDTDGSNPRRMTFTPNIREYHVDWSPDGARLLYTSESEMDVAADLCILTISTMQEACLFVEEGRWEGYGGWSPDSGAITYTAFDGENWGIYTVNADATGVRQWTSGTNRVYDATWSPTGDAIVYSENDGTQSDIHLLDLNTGEVRRLTVTRASDFHPSWSPDGELIAFDSNQLGDYELFVMRVSTGMIIRQLTRDTVLEVYPGWSP